MKHIFRRLACGSSNGTGWSVTMFFQFSRPSFYVCRRNITYELRLGTKLRTPSFTHRTSERGAWALSADASLMPSSSSSLWTVQKNKLGNESVSPFAFCPLRLRLQGLVWLLLLLTPLLLSGGEIAQCQNSDKPAIAARLRDIAPSRLPVGWSLPRLRKCFSK